MTKVLVERDLLESIADNGGYASDGDFERLCTILARPAQDVEASVPTFPCESCGAFHSYSEVAEAGGYCPQCEADYDERKMFADLLERYTALAAAPQPVAQQKVVMPDDKTIEHVMADVCEENKEFEMGIPYYALCVYELKEVVARLNRSKT